MKKCAQLTFILSYCCIQSSMMNLRKAKETLRRLLSFQFEILTQAIRETLRSLIRWLDEFFLANKGPQCVLTAEQLEEYCQLTFLNRSEINYIFRKFCSLDVRAIERDFYHRFSMEEISNLFPQLKFNPFRERIFRVFSESEWEDESLNFEEFLNLCSVFSENCPLKVKAAWAFLIYDFDEDNQISKEDIGELIDRLTCPQMLSDEDRLKISEGILDDMDIQHSGSLNQVEFLHAMSKLPDFVHVFSFKP